MIHKVYCLSVHEAYLCRHAGACCTAGWAIPIEEPAYHTVKLHFGGRLPEHQMFHTGGSLPDGAAAILGTTSDGACVFFEPERGRLCAIHRELGSPRLPSACRQFPRVVLHDARGTLITLSHYCPTAAGLLLSAEPLQIVDAPAALALNGDLEGLDAREVLPPLLRPGMLTDCDGYDAWERRAVATLGRDDLACRAALGIIAEATRAIQTWRPGKRTLQATVEHEFDVASGREEAEDVVADEQRVRLALASIPPGLFHPPALDGRGRERQWTEDWRRVHDRTIRRYLAARLFGNWIAYYGQGLHTVVEYLRISRAVLEMEAARLAAGSSSWLSTASAWQTVIPAIRNADLLLVHLSNTKRLANQPG